MASGYSPSRIASLQPSATVILARLGRLDRIVACTKYCVDVCPEVAQKAKTVVSDSWTAKADEILAAKPDFVIAAVPYQEKAIAEILKSGVRFLGLAPKSLQDVYGDIAVLASLTNSWERGEQIIADMKAQIEAIRSQAVSSSRPRVFCEEWGKPLITSQLWVKELVEAVGGEFVGQPGMQIPANDVLQADPEVMVAAWCGAGDRVPLEKIVRDRGWEQTSAARNGRVYCIRDEFLNTPAPTLLDGLRALAAALHPDRFPQAAGLRCIAAAVTN